MTEPMLQKRRDLMDGYILSPTGAMVIDAVRTADISNPSNRENLERKGNVILTRHNRSQRPAELQSQPPDIQSCQQVIAAVVDRQDAAVSALRVELEDAREELKSRDLNRMERGYWRERVKSIETKLEQMAAEEITAKELYAAFVREDVSLRAQAVPPEQRAALEAIERERNLTKELAEIA